MSEEALKIRVESEANLAGLTQAQAEVQKLAAKLKEQAAAQAAAHAAAQASSVQAARNTAAETAQAAALAAAKRDAALAAQSASVESVKKSDVAFKAGLQQAEASAFMAEEVKKASAAYEEQERVAAQAHVADLLGTNKSNAATEKASALKHKLRDAIRGVGQVIPGVGGLLSAFLNPISIAVMAAIGSLALLISWLRKVYDTTAELSTQRDLVDAVQRWKASMAGSEGDIREYVGTLDSIGESAATAAEKLATLNSELDRQKSNQDRVDDAQRAAEIAKAKRDTSDPVAQLQKVAEIEERFAKRKLDRETNLERQKVTNHEQALDEAVDSQDALAKTAADKQEQRATYAGLAASKAGQTEAQEKRFKEASDTAIKYASVGEEPSVLGIAGFAIKGIVNIPKAVKEAEEKAELEGRILENMRKDDAAVKAKAAIAAKEAAIAEERAKKNIEAIESLKRDLEPTRKRSMETIGTLTSVYGYGAEERSATTQAEVAKAKKDAEEKQRRKEEEEAKKEWEADNQAAKNALEDAVQRSRGGSGRGPQIRTWEQYKDQRDRIPNSVLDAWERGENPNPSGSGMGEPSPSMDRPDSGGGNVDVRLPLPGDSRGNSASLAPAVSASRDVASAIDRLAPVLVDVLKSQNKRIDALAADLRTLEGRASNSRLT